MLYVVYFVLGLAWWYIVLLGTGPMTSAASFQTISNNNKPNNKKCIFMDPSRRYIKNIVGIPLCVTFWPIELIAVIYYKYFLLIENLYA